MSLLGSISHGFEAMAESITSGLEARPEVVQSRLAVLKDAISDTSYIHVNEVSPASDEQRSLEQTPTIPLKTVDFVPVPARPETLAPVVFTDESFTTAIATDLQSNPDLDADQIRAKLDTIRYAQMDTQALAQMANRSQN